MIMKALCNLSTTVRITNLLCFLVCTVHFGEKICPQFVLNEKNKRFQLFFPQMTQVKHR